MKLKTLSIILAFFILSVGSVSVSAATGIIIPELSDLPKSLTIQFSVQKSGVDTPIAGAQIGINKIASLHMEGGQAYYKVTEDYLDLAKFENDCDVTFNGLSVSDSIVLAKQFSEVATAAEQTAVTDDKGQCKFQIAEQGMYLVQELSAVGDADKYELFAPYIISVPYPENYSGSWEWLYDVLSEPKTVITPKPVPTEPTKPEVTTKPSEPNETTAPGKPTQPDATSATSAPQNTTILSQPDNSVKTGESVPYLIVLGALIAFVCVMAIVQRSSSENKNRDKTE